MVSRTPLPLLRPALFNECLGICKQVRFEARAMKIVYENDGEEVHVDIYRFRIS